MKSLPVTVRGKDGDRGKDAMKTCKLFFIHGIGNEGESADTINASWLKSLKAAWSRDGRPLDTVHLNTSAAFYGDKLADLTRTWLNDELSIIDQGVAEGEPLDTELITLYQEYAETLIRPGTAAPPLGPEGQVVITEMGFPHNKAVKALARVIEALSPENGNFLAKKFLPQAAAYIRRPGAAATIDSIVEQQLRNFLGMSSNALIVAHSLGTVVGYRILRKLSIGPHFPLFMTLGSPLGSTAIQRVLPHPRTKPVNVDRWVNVADHRDFVALHPELNERTFGNAQIANLEGIQNGKNNRHSIEGYLNNPIVSETLWNLIRETAI